MRPLLCNHIILICSSPLAKQLNVTGSFRRDEIFRIGVSNRAGSTNRMNK